jgi:integrase/recombinase XerC
MIHSFLDYLRYEERASEHTLIAYQQDLLQFSEFCKSNEAINDNLSDVTYLTIRAWIVSLTVAYTARSINRKIACLNAYYSFLIKKKVIESSPTTRIHALKSVKVLPEFVKESEMDRLGDFTFSNDFEGKRDQLIIELLYGTGMRANELLLLTLSDIDLIQSTIKVQGKRNKQRIVPLHDSLKILLGEYLSVRPTTEHKQLITTSSGKPAYAMLIYRSVKTYLSLTSVSKKSPHVLRHTFATHLLNEGAAINDIKELLGHSNLAATEIYTHNSLERIRQVYEKAHPKA